MNSIRVLLADDHALVRAGIRALLQDLAAIEVVAEAGSGEEALQAIRTHCPDVVLMDIMMPGLTGLEALDRLSQEQAPVRVIMLSMDASKPLVLRAMRAGASGYLLKNVSPGELANAIRAVAQGDIYLDAAITKHVLAAGAQRGRGKDDSLEQLSPRQHEVLKLVAEGNSNKVIARKLQLSVKTVEMHRAEAMRAVGLRDAAGLVRYAIRMGVISADA
jgi:DNA-binding NarL/FixJ family response regulator